MARIAMVTRTIVTTGVTVLCLNLTTTSVETKVITLTGNLDEKAILKVAHEKLDTDTLKVAYVASVKDIETLYGMTEDDFIKIAKVLPPRGMTSESATTETTVTE